MEGYKLIKTTFENNKEIVGVYFNGDESYYTFLNEGTYVHTCHKICKFWDSIKF